MAELEEAYRQKATNRQLGIQERSVTNAEQATANQYNLGIKQTKAAEDAAAKGFRASMIASGVQAPIAGAAMYGAGKQMGWWGAPTTKINIPGADTTASYFPETGYSTSTPYPSYTPSTNIPTTATTGNIGTTAPDMWTTPQPINTGYSPVIDTTGTMPSELSYVYDTGAASGTAAPAAAEATGMGAADAIGGMWQGVEVPAYEAGTAGTEMASGASSVFGNAIPVVGAGMLGGKLGAAGGKAIGKQVDFGGENEWGIGGGIAGGATAGSMFGPVGTIVGGVVGGVTAAVTGDEGTVICTELHRQGFMTDELYATESRFGQSLPHEAMDGYRRWANSIVKAMRKHKWATVLTYALTYHVIREMAHRVDPEKYPDSPIIGRLYLRFGVPMCMWLGRDRHVPAIEGVGVV
jgi:hypothetical protein